MEPLLKNVGLTSNVNYSTFASSTENNRSIANMNGIDGKHDVREPVDSSSEEGGPGETPLGQTKRSWYRSVPFQITVASGVSFTAPGMWDALGGLGAGGAAEPYAVSAANALVYGLFSIVCVLAGAINNRIGLPYGLALGAIGYPLYGAGLYTNNVHPTTWFMLFGSALCGISAGFFWAAEAAIIIGYPSPTERAFYLAIWQTAKASGPIVGGAINLCLNANRSTAGSVGSATYIVFIAIMCLGLPITLLLSPATKVWRKDNTKVIINRQPSWTAECKAVWKELTSRRILLLLPAFFISYFYNGYNSTFLTQHFTVRSRAFSSFFTNFSGIFSSFLIAGLLDRQSINIKTRAKIAFSSIITILIGTWIWASILLKQFQDAPEVPVFDWFTGGFGKSYALVFFWAFGGQAFQQFLYWLVGQYATDISSLSRVTGILRGFEALGQTVAWAMQTAPNANGFASIGVNFGMTALCVFPTWIVLSELDHSHEGEGIEESTLEGNKIAEDSN